MNVTCPECSAKYKIDESKIQGRGAKITCPKCSHKFVVTKGSEAPASDVARLDFTRWGIRWRVRKPIGMTYEFSSLGAIRQAIADRQIDTTDQLSYDGAEWIPLNEIKEVENYFQQIWDKAESGQIKAAPPPAAKKPQAVADEDDEGDAPTTIVKMGSSLSDEIRRAVADAATPIPEPATSGPKPVGISKPASSPPGAPPAAQKPDPFSPLQKQAPPPAAGPNVLMLVGVGVLFVVLLGAALWFSGVIGG